MKTEYKKVSELLAFEDAEVLKEFEMVELQGGVDFWTCDNTGNYKCTFINASKCLLDCKCTGTTCQIKP